jgi:hypothetical protein
MELPAIVRHVQFRNEKGFAILACDLDPFSAKYTSEMDTLIEGAVNEKYQTFPVSLGMLDPHEDIFLLESLLQIRSMVASSRRNFIIKMYQPQRMG